MSTYSFQQLWPFQDYIDSYFSRLNGDIAVLSRIAAQFSVSETSTPSMSLAVASGAAFRSGVVVEVDARNTPAIVAPTTNPRIDRVVINYQTDAVLVVQGTEATTPVAPLVPTGYIPLARVSLIPAMTVVTNISITDERLLATGAPSSGSLLNVQTFAVAGTFIYTATPGTRKIIVEVQGGGASAGGTDATTASGSAASSGGGAGAYARALITTGFDGATVIVGAGGALTAAGYNYGNNGGSSSFASLVLAPGGVRGGPGGPATVAYAPAAGVSAFPTGGNLVSAVGIQGTCSFVLAFNIAYGGTGGSSYFGGGGIAGANSVGGAAQSPGAGGGGTSSPPNTASRTGAAGAAGLIIVQEYA